MNIPEAINELGLFCGLRDIDSLDRSALHEKYGFEQTDVFVLLKTMGNI